MKRSVLPLGMLAWCCVAAAQPAADPVAALEALLNTEIEGASRHAERSLDAPANVGIVGRAEAFALGHQTVGDMLARLPGTYITSSRTYSSVGLRGFNRPGDYNARILMAIDGYRVNDALYDQALPELEFPIPADWVKRLELVNGPASSVYGGNALLGVVNAVTLDGADAPGLGLRTVFGPSGSRKATAQYGWHLDDRDLFVGVTAQRLAGETLQLPALAGSAWPGGAVQGLDGTRYASVFAKLRWGAWRTTVVAQQREKNVATAAYGTLAGVPGTVFDDRYAYLETVYEGAWRGDWRPAARFNLSTSSFHGRYVYAAEGSAGEAGDPQLINVDRSRSSWAGLDARVHWRGLLNHALVVGTEVRRTLRASQRNFDEMPAASYLDRTDRQRQLGLYAQDQIRLSERWLATVGLRADRLDGFATQFSPRLALVFRPLAGEAVKLMAGRAFRAPNLNERFYDDAGSSQAANPRLGPEKLTTVELAWERAVGSEARLTLALYSYLLDDMIDFVPLDGPVSQYRNVSQGRSTGFDIDYERRFASRWQLRSTLSLGRARINGQTTTNAPHWLLKGHLFGPLAEAWSLGAQWQAVGRRHGAAGDVGAYATADLVLRRQWGTGHSAALAVRNIADRATWDPSTPDTMLSRIPRERRSVWLDLVLGF